MSEIIERDDIVFVRDTAMSREDFESLPYCKALGNGAVADVVKAHRGQLCRARIARDGTRDWHVAALIYLNGTDRVTAARVQLGRYQREV